MATQACKIAWYQKFGVVAQLVRALPCHGKGRGFESRRPRRNMERDNFQKTDAILLCGGVGSRIREISGDLPKSLLDVGGKPLIQYSLDNLEAAYIRHLIFAIDYRTEQIQEWVLSRNLPNSEIYFSHQTQSGVLPAIISALNFLGEDDFVTCDTDEIQLGFSLTEFLESYNRSNTLATMLGVYSNHLYRHRVLNVRETDNLVIETELESEGYLQNPEQRGLVNGGIVIMNRRALEFADAQHSTGWSGIIDPLCHAGQLSVHVMPNVTYFNINTVDEYMEAIAFLGQ